MGAGFFLAVGPDLGELFGRPVFRLAVADVATAGAAGDESLDLSDFSDSFGLSDLSLSSSYLKNISITKYPPELDNCLLMQWRATIEIGRSKNYWSHEDKNVWKNFGKNEY